MKDEDKTKEQLIEELRELRLKMDDSHQLKTQMIENFGDGILLIDARTGNILFVNPKMNEMFGYVSNELIHQHVSILNGPDEEKAFETIQTIQESLHKRGNWSGEIYNRRKDKSCFWSEVRLSTLEHSKYGTVWLGVQSDITERKQTEDALRESEFALRRAERLAGTGYFRRNIPKRRNNWSPGALFVLGMESSQKMGYKSFLERVHPDDQKNVRSEIEQALSGRGGYNIEYRIVLPHGQERIIHAEGQVVFDEEGQAEEIFGTVQDITERRQIENQLRHAQKIESLGTLVGGIAHEFNNLLVPILGHTEMLKEKKTEDDPERKNLDQIQEAGNRARDLVQQMLAYGRKSISARTSVPLETLVDNTLKLLKNVVLSSISIKQEYDDELPPILGMPNEINQVIFNLCLNAIHAMPNGGELTIRLKNKGFHEFTNAIGQKKEGNFIELIVQDTGGGMDPAVIERIFDPFFTTKEVGQGTGLGLSVVQGIVEQHQGQILVESKLGGGTTFHVYFPISNEEIQPVDTELEPPTRGIEHIFLIDDEPMINDLVKTMLKHLGYRVTEFFGGGEALKWFTDHPHDFDLVLTDYGMPEMTGKQLAELIKKVRPEIPIILMTGYGDLVKKEGIAQWGMEGLLMKPFDMKEVSEIIREVLDSNETLVKS